MDVNEVSITAPDNSEVDALPLRSGIMPTPAPPSRPTSQIFPVDSDIHDFRDTEFVFVLRRYDTILEDKVYSPWHLFGGYRWRLLIFTKGNQSSNLNLSVYLECGGPTNRLNVSTDYSAITGSVATGTNGKELAVLGLGTGVNQFWSRPAKFSLHLVHPLSSIGRHHLGSGGGDDDGGEGGLSDLSESDIGEGLVPDTRADLVKETYHVFREKARDFGFLDFAPFASLQPTQYADEHMNVVIMVRIRLQDSMCDAMLGNTLTWDSRKETGFVGFKNQGATCYMNALLQTLYMVSAFRTAIYNMPLPEPGNENSGSELSYALQKIFYELQYSPTVVETKKLTESFGWDTTDAFTQHDVQELKLILCHELAEKMKNISPNRPNSLFNLLQGKLLNYIECVDVNYKSSTEERFSDLSLNVKGCRNVYDSFEKYVQVEMMEGDNKYRATGYNELQNARKGVKILKLPPVLHLHLKRFEYDFSRYSIMKINDRYEFETEMDLSPYVEKSDGKDIYVLHSVLVHSGDPNGGHYHVFIRPEIDISNTEPEREGKWFKFDDETVQLVSEELAVEENYGFGGELDFASKRVPGMDEGIGNGGINGCQTLLSNLFQSQNRNSERRRCSNAYMLQYLRKQDLNYLLKEHNESDVPKALAARIKKDRELEERKKKEATEQHLYVNIAVAVDYKLVEHHGADLVQWDNIRQLRVKRSLLLGELKERLENENIIKDARLMWLWRCSRRLNDTIRPDALVADGIDTKPISYPNARDLFAKTGSNMPLNCDHLGYYGQDDFGRMYAEDFCSPYCLGAGQAYEEFIDTKEVNGEIAKGDEVQNLTDVDTDHGKPGSKPPKIPTFQLACREEVLLFVKYYTPAPNPKLQWLGHFVVKRITRVNELQNFLKRALESHRRMDPMLPCIDEGAEIAVFKEVAAHTVTRLENSKTLEGHLMPYKIGTGDILLFQKDVSIAGLGNGNKSNINSKAVGSELSDGSNRNGLEWNGAQNPSNDDGTDLPLGGRPLPTVGHYFDYLASRLKIDFKDKETIGTPDEGKSILLEILLGDSYATATGILAKFLRNGADPDYLRFFPHDQIRRTAAQEPLQIRGNEELQRVLPIPGIFNPVEEKYIIMWYERTEYHISEFDEKDEVRVVWREDGGARLPSHPSIPVANDMGRMNTPNEAIVKEDFSVSIAGGYKDERLAVRLNDDTNRAALTSTSGIVHNIGRYRSFSVLVDPDSKYRDVMVQVRNKLHISQAVQIRMFEVRNRKIFKLMNPNDHILQLMTGSHDFGVELRAEPVPEDETVEALGNEYELMTVLHLEQDKQQRLCRGLTFFGTPFLIKVKKDGEPISLIRQRIQEKLGISYEEFEQWPLAEILQLKVTYLNEVDVLYGPHTMSPLDTCMLAIEHKGSALAKKMNLGNNLYADKPLKIRS